MKYETTIGLRYLRSKRKEAFISFTTWISIVGIAIGVMALIVVIAVMTGFQDEIRERILGVNPHILVLNVNGDIRDPGKATEVIKKVGGVTHAFPFVSFQAMVQSGRQLSGVAVKGLNAGDVQFMNRLLKEGSVDVLNRKGHILIGKELSKHVGLLPGDSLTLMVPFGGYSPMGAMPETVRVRVGGIFETGMYEIDNTLIIMPLKDVEEIMGITATGIEIKLSDVYKADELRKEIVKQLGVEYFARTWIEMNRNLFSALKLEKIAMFIILALIIFVASFNIISSLVMTVMEKQKDIAILKSIGAKKRSIMKIFMIEGVTIGVVGALIGSLTGYILCEIVKRYKIIRLPEDIYYISTLPVKISVFDIVLIACVTMVICVVSTIYPSYRATKIDPVETLRYE
ncbi:MAG TPA: lipoprotein-releasing ABC transporter permease subunit [Syntrophorhabdaceae bacterium]|nr:lipoprotein-releasing ABC transporter permease subunit [Syntrophorhabdaceae bacterium]HQM82274.1 lipoprotein-releasing ABC transporter permease subunit [Syntrophorhabdaceae bacterium]